MYIKYVNPIFNMPHITEFIDAYITHDMDEDGKETKDFVLMINCSNEYEYCLCVRKASFTRLNEILNELYDNGKVDISTDPSLEILAYPKVFEGMDVNDLLDLDSISSSDDSDYDDDFLDEDYYND